MVQGVERADNTDQKDSGEPLLLIQYVLRRRGEFRILHSAAIDGTVPKSSVLHVVEGVLGSPVGQDG